MDRDANAADAIAFIGRVVMMGGARPIVYTRAGVPAVAGIDGFF
jgi:hypothetical protein